MKRCRRCEAEKPLEGFPANPRMRDGRSSWCQGCHNKATARWRAANPDYVQAYNERRRTPPLSLRYFQAA